MPDSTPDRFDHHIPFIKERLPRWASQIQPQQARHLRYLSDTPEQPWLCNAIPALREEFEQAQARVHAVSTALAGALSGLKTAAEFAEPLLWGRLRDALDFQGNLREVRLVRFSPDWKWPVTERYLAYRIESLLEAALQNFAPDQEWLPESVVISGDFRVTYEDGRARYHYNELPITPAMLARECHALDLGNSYQQHLRDVFRPVETRRLAIEARKAHLRLDVLKARICYNLRDDCQRLRQLLGDEPLPSARPMPRCHRLSLFGIDVHDALVIRPWPNSEAVMLHLPGLDEGALTRHATQGACERYLLQRLCEPGMRQQFLTFIHQGKREHFASVLQRNLTGDTRAEDLDAQWPVPSEANLHWYDAPIDEEVFAYLHDRHVRRLLDEAKLVAVPSANVDEAARQARIRYWESIGLDVLGVAAFFIPAAGQLMAAVFVVQLLDEVYEGVKAWNVGDIDAALGHVKAVALDVASAVGTAVALNYASKLGSKLVEVARADGTPRLWNGDLRPWRTSLTERAVRNEAGQWVNEGRHYFVVDAEHYEQRLHADGQRWELHDPEAPGAFRPAFEHNGKGAWMGTHEAPHQWPRQTLLRRIGHSVERYSDDELEVASRISGVDRDDLLDIYIKGQPAPTRLLETLKRLRGDDLSPSPLERLCESLYRPSRSTPASDRLVLTSLLAEPRWPSACSLELRAGSLEGPTLERVGDRLATDQRLIVKVPGGYRAATGEGLQSVHDDLFEALAEAMPEFADTPRTLKGWIAERAHGHPERTLGQVWPGASNGWTPRGRLLGGSDRPATYPPAAPTGNALIDRYRRLYPTASREHAQAELRAWLLDDQQPHLVLRALEQQLEYLRGELGRWAGNNLGRLRVQDALLHSWRRLPVHRQVLKLAGLGLSEDDFLNFPHLNGAFGHVRELVLDNNPLRTLPTRLTCNFPDLRCLWANAAQLEHLPAGLGEQMTVMELHDNGITWTAQSQAALDGYPRLEMLNLTGNPLREPPNVSRLSELNELSLSDTSISRFPQGLELLEDLQSLDLSSNQITEIPDPQILNPSAQRALSLEFNPLNPAALERIESYYAQTGIDLMISEEDFSTMLYGADDQIRACWDRLSRSLPLQYRREVRQLSDTAMNYAAPETTRRRFWFLLQWLDSGPHARAMATSRSVSDLFLFELTAEVDLSQAFATARAQTEHILGVATASVRYQAVTDALLVRFPTANPLQLETLRALTYQQVANVPEVPLRLAPTLEERVESLRAGELLQFMDNQWLGQLRDQLISLAATSPNGRDALLAETAEGTPVHPVWTDWLRIRYADDFTQLQEQATAWLQAAELQMSEGDYLIEADRLRRAFEQSQRQLLEDLTRSIADGSQTHW